MRNAKSPDRRLTAGQAESLVAISEPWLSCDSCFDQIDGCVDALADGAGHIDLPLRVHLARCTACWEEAETLLSLAARDRNVDEGPLLALMRSLVHPPATEPARSPTFVARTLNRRRR
ncbi:MAG TPA: hypothetical protein VFH38_09795 [Jatrophihabitans sp.]|nr:hypothetical protein [Jatrophihabitans sp.]